MKYKHLLCLVIILGGCKRTGGPLVEQDRRGIENIAYQWCKVSLEGTARDTDRFRPRPTVTSRILALIWTSVFDAWSRYDVKATPVYLAGVDRSPESERTITNREKAISYAAYRTLLEYYSSDSLYFTEKFIEFGFDPFDNSLDAASPSGIGNLAAKAVIEARRNDGSNQYGDMSGSSGMAYSDYTGYQPVNTPDQRTDINRWQPKYFSDGKGGQFAPGCLTPHWPNVKPIALTSSDQFRPGPPPLVGSPQLEKEVLEVVEWQANLTDEERALVEFMRDGPKSVQQAGHWLIFSQVISIRDHHTLDDDVKMYFLVTAAAMDGFIAAWDSKMYYDFARPFALVHQYFRDKEIRGWGGPAKGMIRMQGKNWVPYSPETFVCPPFPSYVSGHSCVSGACSMVLRLFTGSDVFGDSVRLAPGAFTEPDNIGDSVMLRFPTFTSTAEQAGRSRVLGGYHIQSDNVAGLELGRTVAQVVYEKFLKHTGDQRP